MFGGNAKIRDLQQQLDELRSYCIKFTADVNNWATAQGKYNDELEKQIAELTAQTKEK